MAAGEQAGPLRWHTSRLGQLAAGANLPDSTGPRLARTALTVLLDLQPQPWSVLCTAGAWQAASSDEAAALEAGTGLLLRAAHVAVPAPQHGLVAARVTAAEATVKLLQLLAGSGDSPARRRAVATRQLLARAGLHSGPAEPSSGWGASEALGRTLSAQPSLGTLCPADDDGSEGDSPPEEAAVAAALYAPPRPPFGLGPNAPQRPPLCSWLVAPLSSDGPSTPPRAPPAPPQRAAPPPTSQALPSACSSWDGGFPSGRWASECGGELGDAVFESLCRGAAARRGEAPPCPPVPTAVLVATALHALRGSPAARAQLAAASLRPRGASAAAVAAAAAPLTAAGSHRAQLDAVTSRLAAGAAGKIGSALAAALGAVLRRHDAALLALPAATAVRRSVEAWPSAPGAPPVTLLEVLAHTAALRAETTALHAALVPPFDGFPPQPNDATALASADAAAADAALTPVLGPGTMPERLAAALLTRLHASALQARTRAECGGDALRHAAVLAALLTAATAPALAQLASAAAGLEGEGPLLSQPRIPQLPPFMRPAGAAAAVAGAQVRLVASLGGAAARYATACAETAHAQPSPRRLPSSALALAALVTSQDAAVAARAEAEATLLSVASAAEHIAPEVWFKVAERAAAAADAAAEAAAAQRPPLFSELMRRPRMFGADRRTAAEEAESAAQLARVGRGRGLAHLATGGLSPPANTPVATPRGAGLSGMHADPIAVVPAVEPPELPTEAAQTVEATEPAEVVEAAETVSGSECVVAPVAGAAAEAPAEELAAPPPEPAPEAALLTASDPPPPSALPPTLTAALHAVTARPAATALASASRAGLAVAVGAPLRLPAHLTQLRRLCLFRNTGGAFADALAAALAAAAGSRGQAAPLRPSDATAALAAALAGSRLAAPGLQAEVPPPGAPVLSEHALRGFDALALRYIAPDADCPPAALEAVLTPAALRRAADAGRALLRLRLASGAAAELLAAAVEAARGQPARGARALRRAAHDASHVTGALLALAGAAALEPLGGESDDEDSVALHRIPAWWRRAYGSCGDLLALRDALDASWDAAADGAELKALPSSARAAAFAALSAVLELRAAVRAKGAREAASAPDVAAAAGELRAAAEACCAACEPAAAAEPDGPAARLLLSLDFNGVAARRE